MGFTTNCFIRKNTPELRQALKDLGYFERGVNIKKYPHLETNIDIINKDHTYGAYFGCDNGKKEEIIGDLPLELFTEGIDCEDNEELFLALASLRDDSDKNQLFISDVRLGSINYPNSIIPKGSMIKCLTDKWNYPKNKFDSTGIPAHKATLQELIEHFK